MATTPQGELIGRIFDRKYRVNELIGSGGMGSVYRATHLEMSREVALKVLDHGIADSDRQVQRFHQEARSSSRLQHPNTIRVYDFGRAEDGRLYLAMELLKGETLADLMRREKRIPLPRTCHIIKQVCKSLAEAHQMGLVHRDLKPDNIFITEIFGERDFVKVLDFGIAKSTEGPEQESLTQTGFICGTPRYLSPEQAMGKTVDPRSDLYALGVLLYEMLSGQPVYSAATPIGIVMKHIKEPPPVLAIGASNGAVSASRLVASMLAKSPEHRPSRASLVAEYLVAIGDDRLIDLPGTPSAAPPPPVAEDDGGATLMLAAPSRPPSAATSRPNAAPAGGPEANKTAVFEGGGDDDELEPTLNRSASAASALGRLSAPPVLTPIARSSLSAAPFADPAPAPFGAPPSVVASAPTSAPSPAAATKPVPPVLTPSSPTAAPVVRASGTSSRPSPGDADSGKHPGLQKVTAKPAQALSMSKAPRKQPTEEVPIQSKSRRGLWIGLGVGAVVFGLTLALILWFTGAPGT
ncbi:MAG: protein kinase [Myxococcales bacterium]|nr:protein kinase [Myxococcales bacterium]